MRLASFVTFLLAVAAMAGCGVRVHYRGGGYAYGYGHHYGYSTSGGTTGIVWNQPAPAAPAPNVAPQQTSTGEFAVTGSDGSYGWEKTCNADVEIHRLSEQMAKKGCQFQSYGYDETRAICGGVSVLLRRDATHVYRLCPPNIDRAQCMNAWAPVLAP